MKDKAKASKLATIAALKEGKVQSVCPSSKQPDFSSALGKHPWCDCLPVCKDKPLRRRPPLVLPCDHTASI